MTDPIEMLLTEYAGRDRPLFISMHGQGQDSIYNVLRVTNGVVLLETNYNWPNKNHDPGMKALVRISSIATCEVPQ